MIFIVSPGRSGSAWLSAVFSACGLTCRHEGWPVIRDPDVLSDTTWLWNKGDLVNSLAARNRVAVTDTVILLNRDRKAIERSVATLIGKQCNWDRVFEQWESLKDAIWNKGLTQHLRLSYKVQYEDLFEPRFKDTLVHILSSSGHADKVENVPRVLDLFRHLRVTNKTSEEETRQTYGYGIGN